MLAYWFLFGTFAAGSFGRVRALSYRLRDAPLLLLAILTMILVIGLRYRVGADWGPYQQIFDALRLTSWGRTLSAGDPGYTLLNRFAAAIGGDVWFVNLVCAAIFGWGLARFAKEQPNPWLAIATSIPYLVIVVAMGYTRQAVAIALIMIAISEFLRARYVHVFVYFFAAVAFHKTAIVVLPLIMLSSLRHRFVIYTGSAVAGLFMFLFFIDMFLSTMLKNYIDSNMTSDGATIRVLMNIIPAIIYLSFPRYFAVTETERIIWRNFSICALALTIGLLTSASSTVVDRISLYLIPLQIFVLSRIPLAVSKDGQPRHIFTILVLTYSAAIQFVWLNFASHAEEWVPYKSYLLT